MSEPTSDELLNRIAGILRHIGNVRANCETLGRELIIAGQRDLGVSLIANSQSHDASKFRGIEFLYLQPDTAKTKLGLAIEQHNHTNPHHPEYWGGIEGMPDVYLCEMVCDWKARSEEFGTSVHEWAQDEAPKRFSYKKTSDVYKKILAYLAMLCDRPFTKI